MTPEKVEEKEVKEEKSAVEVIDEVIDGEEDGDEWHAEWTEKQRKLEYKNAVETIADEDQEARDKIIVAGIRKIRAVQAQIEEMNTIIGEAETLFKGGKLEEAEAALNSIEGEKKSSSSTKNLYDGWFVTTAGCDSC